MAEIVPLSDDARQSFLTRLAGVSVRVSAWWQPPEAAWYLSLETANAVPIIRGRRLVGSGRPLRDIKTSLGTGELYVSGPGEPGRHAWTRTHRLFWASQAELEQAAIP